MDDTTTEPAWEPAPVDPTWLSAEHVFESEMKDDRRTDGHRHHERRPAG